MKITIPNATALGAVLMQRLPTGQIHMRIGVFPALVIPRSGAIAVMQALCELTEPLPAEVDGARLERSS